MVQLQSSLFNVGDIVIKANHQIDNVYFIVKGQCTIYGVHKKGYKDYIQIPVVKLNEGCWYGDYNSLLSVKSDWQMEATRAPKKQKGISEGKIQLFKLDHEAFTTIC